MTKMPARQHAKVTKWLSERFDGQEGMKLHIKRKHLCASLNITSLVIGKQDTRLQWLCYLEATWVPCEDYFKDAWPL